MKRPDLDEIRRLARRRRPVWEGWDAMGRALAKLDSLRGAPKEE